MEQQPHWPLAQWEGAMIYIFDILWYGRVVGWENGIDKYLALSLTSSEEDVSIATVGAGR